MPRGGVRLGSREAFEREEVRAKVLALREAKKGYGAIASALKMKKATVQSIIKVYGKREDTSELPRKGRQSKLTARYVLFGLISIMFFIL